MRLYDSFLLFYPESTNKYLLCEFCYSQISFFLGLRRHLSLVEGAELYAVVRDSTKAVVSLPPVTNSERSKVRLHLKTQTTHNEVGST